jgi:protein ImuA
VELISCHSGRLQSSLASKLSAQEKGKSFATDLQALDELAPGQCFARGAIHELLSPARAPVPLTAALLLARCAAARSSAIVWCDPSRLLYPPALATAGIDLARLFILRPRNRAEESWALAEVLRCRGVGAAVASVGKLTRVEARRLQLAAETGSSVGILLRPMGAVSSTYAAATRWLVEPEAGERTVQRWRIQLIHGHGGRIGQTVYLENCRETNTLRATAELADRSSLPQVRRASA